RRTVPAPHQAWQALFDFNGTPPPPPAGRHYLAPPPQSTPRGHAKRYASNAPDPPYISPQLPNPAAFGTGVHPPPMHPGPAARIYATLLHTPHPDPAQYKRLQDFLFRYIAQECGRLNLPVHIHTTSGGGGYFDIAGDNPLLLEPLFNDPRLRKTNFVLLHGG